MKSINAAVLPNSLNTSLLSERNCAGRMNTSAIKRDERRKQRRALRAELPSVVFGGMVEGCLFSVKSLEKVESTKSTENTAEKDWFFELPRKVAKLFTVPAGYNQEQARLTTVTVKRKRHLHRMTVENLMMAA